MHVHQPSTASSPHVLDCHACPCVLSPLPVALSVASLDMRPGRPASAHHGSCVTRTRASTHGPMGPRGLSRRQLQGYMSATTTAHPLRARGTHPHMASSSSLRPTLCRVRACMCAWHDAVTAKRARRKAGVAAAAVCRWPAGHAAACCLCIEHASARELQQAHQNLQPNTNGANRIHRALACFPCVRASPQHVESAAQAAPTATAASSAHALPRRRHANCCWLGPPRPRMAPKLRV
jgi:hypothetical protein